MIDMYQISRHFFFNCLKKIINMSSLTTLKTFCSVSASGMFFNCQIWRKKVIKKNRSMKIFIKDRAKLYETIHCTKKKCFDDYIGYM